jgi:hypothetical protein
MIVVEGAGHDLGGKRQAARTAGAILAAIFGMVSPLE